MIDFFMGYLGHRSGPCPNHRCHGGTTTRPMNWHPYLVSAASMDDMASMCPGRGEPSLNVGKPRPPCTARLVSSMPHNGPPSVAYMARVLDYTAIAYGGTIPLRRSKGRLLLFVPRCGSGTYPSGYGLFQDHVCLAGPEGARQALCTGFSPLSFFNP